jgi:hypothetical protein
MKRIASVAFLALFLLASTTAFAAAPRRRVLATCTGSTPCRACKNCNYCKHCAKDGGKCGVCRRRRAEARTWSHAAHDAAALR